MLGWQVCRTRMRGFVAWLVVSWSGLALGAVLFVT